MLTRSSYFFVLRIIVNNELVNFTAVYKDQLSKTQDNQCVAITRRSCFFISPSSLFENQNVSRLGPHYYEEAAERHHYSCAVSLEGNLCYSTLAFKDKLLTTTAIADVVLDRSGISWARITTVG